MTKAGYINTVCTPLSAGGGKGERQPPTKFSKMNLQFLNKI